MVDNHDPYDPEVIGSADGDPLAFLYDAEDEEEADDSGDNPAYGSLLGVNPRAEVARKKAMAIVLDADEAQRAAEVMEINAGQLMTNPDRSHRNVGFLNLDPLEAMQEVEEEEDLAESLSWEGEDEDDAEWKPENPLAGTEFETEDEDPDWRPENPLAGTGLEADDEDAEWRPENPLAGTAYEHADEGADWRPENPLAGTEYENANEDADWQPENPLAGTGFEEASDFPSVHDLPAPASASPDHLSACAEEDDWIDSVPSAGQFAARKQLLAEEQAWTPEAEVPAGEEPQFEEVEWDGPFAAGGEGADQPVDAGATFDKATGEAEQPGLEAPLPGSAEAEFAQEPVAIAPVEWQTLLEKWVGETPFEQSQPDGGGIAAERPADGDQPDVPPGFAAEPPEPEWRPVREEEAADECLEPLNEQWPGPAAAGLYEDETPFQNLQPEPVEPAQIEIVRFPAPQIPETPKHSLRAKVLNSRQPGTSRSELAMKALLWLAALAKRMLPHVKRLLAWAREQWTQLASRVPRN